MAYLSDSDRAAPPSLNRSDCSSIESVASPRHGGFDNGIVLQSEGDSSTPRLAFAPQFSLQPYLKSYVLHSQVKASLLERSGRPLRGTGMQKRPFSAPGGRHVRQRDVIVINGLRYVPANDPGVQTSDVLQPLHGVASSKLSMSRIFTDFATPSKCSNKNEGQGRFRDSIRQRPWSAHVSAKEMGCDKEQEHSMQIWKPEEKAAARKRPSSARGGFTHPHTVQVLALDRRRPSSAHPTSTGASDNNQNGRNKLHTDEAMHSKRRPHSASGMLIQGPTGNHTSLSPSEIRPQSATRIRFKPQSAEHHGLAHDVVSGAPETRMGSKAPNGFSMRPTNGRSNASRPSSATARRQVQQETTNITSYSQDPIHPERLQVTYVTRNKQLEDSHMNIQYDDENVSMDGRNPLYKEEEERMRRQHRRSHARETMQSPRNVGGVNRSHGVSNLLPQHPEDRNDHNHEGATAGQHHQRRAATSAILMAAGERDLSQSKARVTEASAMLVPGSATAALEARRTRPVTAPRAHGYTNTCERPSTAPSKRHQDLEWQHRMERIWEKRFASVTGLQGAQTEGEEQDLGQVSTELTGKLDGIRTESKERKVSAHSGEREVELLRKQMRVLEDAQRDLWFDLDRALVPERTGIDQNDPWLRSAQRSSSSACVVS